MLTYKDNNGDYTAPTEIIPINNCCTVKSADDELNVKNTFVSEFYCWLMYLYRKSWFRIGPSISKVWTTAIKKLG